MNAEASAVELIRRIFAIYWRRGNVVLPVATALFGVVGIASALLVAAEPRLILVALLLLAIATTAFGGMVVPVVASDRSQTAVSIWDLPQAIDGVWKELLAVALIAGVGIFLGFLLAVIPGLILATVWSLVAPIVVIEHPGTLRALGRSRELVRGRGRKVFGVLLATSFLTSAVASGIALALGLLGPSVGVVARVVLVIVTAPLGAITAAVLYFEVQRDHS
jgi:hypothetical protein